MSSDEEIQTHYALLEGDGDTGSGGRPMGRASSFAAAVSAPSAPASASLAPASSAPIVSTNPFDDDAPSTPSSSAAASASSSSSSSSSSPSTNPFDDDDAVLQTNRALNAKNLLHAQSIRQPSTDAIKSARYVSFGEAAFSAGVGGGGSGTGGAFANGTHHSLDETGNAHFPRAPPSMDASHTHSLIHSMDESKPGSLLKLKSLIEFDVEPDNGDRPSDCLQLKTTCHFFCIYIPVVFAFVIGMLLVQYGSLYLVRVCCAAVAFCCGDALISSQRTLSLGTHAPHYLFSSSCP